MLYKKIQIKYNLILFLLLNTLLLNAQNTMDYTIEGLSTKNKSELILIAKDLLKEKHPEFILNTNDFDIRVWNSDYGKIHVIFRRSIRYVTNENEETNYDITVDLISKDITPLDDPDMPFYSPSKEAETTIGALKAKGLLPKSNTPDIEYTITENETYYLISCFDNMYDVDKSLITNRERPYLSKSLLHKTTGDMLFFKGYNPFYYVSQITFKHYYENHLYAVLKAENTTDLKAIIKLATSILKEQHPDLEIDPSDFEIMLLGNYKDLIVKYRRYIRFNKGNEDTVFDLAVNVITKAVAPFNTSETSFYRTSVSDENTIKFIENIIPLEKSANTEHTVSENGDYFYVTSIFERSTTQYFINKQTNEVVWTNDSYTLQMNNREDLSLQEHYRRKNGLFGVKSEDNTPLETMTLAVLKANQFVPNIMLDDYSMEAKSSKNEVEVTLTRLVNFKPLRHENIAKLDSDLRVNLVAGMVSPNPEQFYVLTEEDRVTINLIETQLADYLKDNKKLEYPIEIIEDKDFYTIKDSGRFELGEYTYKKYRFDKKTKQIEVIESPMGRLLPSPDMEPMRPTEIKE